MCNFLRPITFVSSSSPKSNSKLTQTLDLNLTIFIKSMILRLTRQKSDLGQTFEIFAHAQTTHMHMRCHDDMKCIGEVLEIPEVSHISFFFFSTRFITTFVIKISRNEEKPVFQKN